MTSHRFHQRALAALSLFFFFASVTPLPLLASPSDPRLNHLRTKATGSGESATLGGLAAELNITIGTDSPTDISPDGGDRVSEINARLRAIEVERIQLQPRAQEVEIREKLGRLTEEAARLIDERYKLTGMAGDGGQKSVDLSASSLIFNSERARIHVIGIGPNLLPKAFGKNRPDKAENVAEILAKFLANGFDPHKMAGNRKGAAEALVKLGIPPTDAEELVAETARSSWEVDEILSQFRIGDISYNEAVKGLAAFGIEPEDAEAALRETARDTSVARRLIQDTSYNTPDLGEDALIEKLAKGKIHRLNAETAVTGKWDYQSDTPMEGAPQTNVSSFYLLPAPEQALLISLALHAGSHTGLDPQSSVSAAYHAKDVLAKFLSGEIDRQSVVKQLSPSEQIFLHQMELARGVGGRYRAGLTESGMQIQVLAAGKGFPQEVVRIDLETGKVIEEDQGIYQGPLHQGYGRYLLTPEPAYRFDRFGGWYLDAQLAPKATEVASRLQEQWKTDLLHAALPAEARPSPPSSPRRSGVDALEVKIVPTQGDPKSVYVHYYLVSGTGHLTIEAGAEVTPQEAVDAILTKIYAPQLPEGTRREFAALQTRPSVRWGDITDLSFSDPVAEATRLVRVAPAHTPPVLERPRHDETPVYSSLSFEEKTWLQDMTPKGLSLSPQANEVLAKLLRGEISQDDAAKELGKLSPAFENLAFLFGLFSSFHGTLLSIEANEFGIEGQVGIVQARALLSADSNFPETVYLIEKGTGRIIERYRGRYVDTATYRIPGAWDETEVGGYLDTRLVETVLAKGGRMVTAADGEAKGPTKTEILREIGRVELSLEKSGPRTRTDDENYAYLARLQHQLADLHRHGPVRDGGTRQGLLAASLVDLERRRAGVQKLTEIGGLLKPRSDYESDLVTLDAQIATLKEKLWDPSEGAWSNLETRQRTLALDEAVIVATPETMIQLASYLGKLRTEGNPEALKVILLRFENNSSNAVSIPIDLWIAGLNRGLTLYAKRDIELKRSDFMVIDDPTILADASRVNAAVEKETGRSITDYVGRPSFAEQLRAVVDALVAKVFELPLTEDEAIPGVLTLALEQKIESGARFVDTLLPSTVGLQTRVDAIKLLRNLL